MTRYELVAFCDGCPALIADGQGNLYERYDEICDSRTEAGAPFATLDIAEILSAPGDIHWRMQHYDCTPADVGDAYQIEVEQLRAWARLTEWTAHLMAKNWSTRSDWSSLLMACATGARGPIAQASVLAAG